MLSVVKGWIGRLALVFIGGVFILAGGLKALDPAGFTHQVAKYHFLPASLAPAVAYGLIAFEVALGTALLLDYRRRVSVGAAVVLLVGFLGLMTYTWATGGNVGECGCFGNFVERTPAETIVEDLVFLAIALLGLTAPARRNPGGMVRGGVVAAMTAATLAFLPLAPRLPLDSIVTSLKPGVTYEGLKLSLPDRSLASGRHLVAILALREKESGAAADGLNAIAGIPGAPGVTAIYADEDDVKDAFFWEHAPSFPMYRVVDEELRRLYRRLPRYFMLEDGVVTAVWETLPATETIVASVHPAQEEKTR